MAAEAAGDWFAWPSELLPAPLYLLGSKRKARRPPALAQPEVAAKRKGVKRAPPPDLPPFMLPDRALKLEGATPLRHARALLGGQIVVVPQRPEDFDDSFADADGELLLVELAGPDGAWLEDREAESVYLGPGRLLPLEKLREYVRRKINLLARPAQKLKKLHQLVRPSCAPDYTLVLVPLSEL